MCLLSYCPSEEDDFYGEELDDSSDIEEIIFGLRCPDQTKQTLKKLFANKAVKFSYMCMKDNKDIYNLIKKDC